MKTLHTLSSRNSFPSANYGGRAVAGEIVNGVSKVSPGQASAKFAPGNFRPSRFMVWIGVAWVLAVCVAGTVADWLHLYRLGDWFAAQLTDSDGQPEH